MAGEFGLSHYRAAAIGWGWLLSRSVVTLVVTKDGDLRAMVRKNCSESNIIPAMKRCSRISSFFLPVLMLCAASGAQVAANGQDANGFFLTRAAATVQPTVAKPPAILLGTAWYPEQWPESRWEADLALMQKAGVHMVRIGEFAWSRMEPREGEYDLDWMDRSITAAAKHGIYTVIGTPSAAPPAWLTQKYPETLRTKEDGRKDQHGNRQQFNFANARYRELARAMAEQMAKRFGHNPHVLGWQIDNEYADVSYDDDTKKQFQEWLKARYSTLENLNTRWTTNYWSESYTDWSQIPIQIHYGNPGLLLSWMRFVSDTWRRHQKN